MHLTFARFAAATLLGFLSMSTVAAQPAALAKKFEKAADIPVDVFFRRAQYADVSLSPDGSKLAAVVPLHGRGNLVVIDLKTLKSTVISSFKEMDVSNFQWINNSRIYLSTADLSEATGSITLRGVYAVDADGTNLRDMSWPLERGMARAARRDSVSLSGRGATLTILSRTLDESGDVIAQIYGRSNDSADVYRYNTKTGAGKLLTFDTPGKVIRWVVDRDLVPRIAVRLEERTDPTKPRQSTLWHRPGEGKPYEQIGAASNSDVAGGITPLGFDYDNQTLYVSSNIGLDKRAIFKYDIAGKKLGEKLVAHPLIDLEGGLVFSRAKKALVGIRFSADSEQTAWFDEDMARFQATMDRTLPNAVNSISYAPDSERYTLIHSHSDTQPGIYYLYDAQSQNLQVVARTRDWIQPELMATRRFIKYKARDGLEIPAWVTIPRGSEGKKLPLVVHIHGGPWVRSYHGTAWGRWPVAQFLASRGYAVLEPEPRGSTGFGRKHYMASMKQWGLAMQDDITDGAMHLVKEGLVDKDRMCLYGGSYGGYATLQGLVKDPDLWRCGVAYVAVTDLELMQTVQWSDTARFTDFYETDFKRRVGDKDADREQFQKTSPAKNADKIKAPVLLVMGAEDIRVPIIHGTTMRDALQRAGKPVEYVVYNDEAHGFNKHENVVDFYTRVEKFFEKHLK
ncbi:MAG: S9 family peptidase [Betaproteobacteria bacterium]|nr:S9 family peptidase [Betaproteobacteria bacterium]